VAGTPEATSAQVAVVEDQAGVPGTP
jgi:hypothetical protein